MVCITFTFNLFSHAVHHCACSNLNFKESEKLLLPWSSQHFLLQLWPASDNTFVEREELIYPIASLVAEVGGTFSLFLGFSFITIWDGCYQLLSFYKSTSLKSFLL